MFPLCRLCCLTYVRCVYRSVIWNSPLRQPSAQKSSSNPIQTNFPRLLFVFLHIAHAPRVPISTQHSSREGYGAVHFLKDAKRRSEGRPCQAGSRNRPRCHGRRIRRGCVRSCVRQGTCGHLLLCSTPARGPLCWSVEWNLAIY